MEQRLSNPEKGRDTIVNEVIAEGPEHAMKIVEVYIDELNDLNIIVNVPLQLQAYKEHVKEQKHKKK